MMDFGLHGLLDRIERDFGKSSANVLTFLIALAIVAGCLTLIGNLISSFSLWLSGITSEATWLGRIGVVVKYMLGAVFLAVMANNLVGALSIRRVDRIIQRQIYEVENLQKEAESQFRAAREQMDDTMAATNELRELVDMAMAVIPEAKDLKRQLPPDTEEEKPQ